MKKILLIGVLALYSHFSNGQQTAENIPSKDTNTIVNKIKALEQRLNSQANDIETLKKENETLKKQNNKAKNAVTFSGSNRTVINRRGSKQWGFE